MDNNIKNILQVNNPNSSGIVALIVVFFLFLSSTIGIIGFFIMIGCVLLFIQIIKYKKKYGNRNRYSKGRKNY